jgi:hypothetical protein
VEAVEWIEGGVEVVVLTEVVVAVELLWVVTDMDHLQQSEVEWCRRRVDQWPRGVDLKARRVLMVILLIIRRGQSLIANNMFLLLGYLSIQPFFLPRE